MSWPRRLLNVFRRKRLARDLERELEFHIAERADELRASGLSAAAAEREARRRFGNYLLQKERTHDADVLLWLDTLGADVRYALRALRANPGFALVAIGTLALGIGATTAIFSLIDAVMLRALPVHAPEELVAVTVGDDGDTFTNPLWEALRDRQDVFAGVTAFNDSEFNLASGGEARRVPGNRVSGGYFAMLGVTPVVGRLIETTDDYRGCPGIAVISAGYWRAEYGGARDVIGRTISLQGKPFQIVGVADPAFSGATVGRASHVYVPLCTEALMDGTSANLDQRSRWWLRVLGRPHAGLTLQAVQARLAALSPAAFAATVPLRQTAEEEAHYRKRTFSAEPAPGGSFSAVRERYSDALRVLMVAVAAVLLIACANVANLLLARATARQHEMALRLAIGAGRARIMRQLLTESLVLSFISSLAGVVLALWGSRALVDLISERNPVSLHLPLDSRMLGFTVLVASTAAFLFGAAPAWRAGRSDPQEALRAGGRGTIRGSARFSAGKALVAGQIALSLALVIVAGLLLGTLRTLWTTHPGFDRERVLLMNVSRAPAAAPAADAVTVAQRVEHESVVYDALLERLRALPGVVSASASQITPLGRVSWNDVVTTPGFEPATPQDAVAFVNEVTDGFFATLGTPLLAGRDFDRRDNLGATPVAIVNETMARKFFGTTSALGRQFTLGAVDGRRYEVIGVVGNSRYQSLREAPQPIAYLARSQAVEPAFIMTFEIRTGGRAENLIAAVKQVAAAVEPTMTLEFATLRAQVAQSIERERMLAALSAFFGALALLLAVIGLYGIMTYNVARRRSEIGIRIALGSARSRVLRMILGEVSWLLALGLALGTALALAGTRIVASFLFGLSPTDPTTMLGAAALFVLVGLAAAGIPAWRASHIDPMAALRQE